MLFKAAARLKFQQHELFEYLKKDTSIYLKLTVYKFKTTNSLLSDLMSYMRSEIVHIYGHYYEIFFDEFNIAIAIEYVYRAYFVRNNN